MNYDFFAPNRIVFGWGRRLEIGKIARQVASRVFLVCGSRTIANSEPFVELCRSLNADGLNVQEFHVASREPEVADVDGLALEFLAKKPSPTDLVLSIGGGSTIDLAKAAAALCMNRESDSVIDYLEGVGKGLQIKNPPLKHFAVPTTAGTGSEVTKNAVISSYNPSFKKSLRSDQMIPQVVVIDPELTVSVPPTTTAATGMDAITQLIESYISCRAAPIPQALAIAGLRLALPALPRALKDGTDRAAREALSHAALLSGLSLANSGLGMAHGVAAALGVHCRIPHGIACAIMLPATLRANLNSRRSDYAVMERLFVESDDDSESLAISFIDRITKLCIEVGIPSRLRDLDVPHSLLPILVKASKGNSMNGNPRAIPDDELLLVLENIW